MSLIDKAPNFFRKIQNFPENGEGTQFFQLVMQNKSVHEILNKALFSDKETKWETDCTVKQVEDYLPVIELLMPLLPEEDQAINKETRYSGIINNRLNSGMKVSKYMSKLTGTETLGKLIPFATRADDTFWNKLYDVMPKLPEGLYQNWFGLFNSFDVLIQNFYSEIANNNNVTLGISTDLFDFLEVCNSPNFTSCYALYKMNESAPFNYAVSRNTAVIYVKNKQSVIGRSWVIFPNDLNQFYVMKPYGFLSKSLIRQAAEHLCTTLGGEWGYYFTDQNQDRWDYNPELMPQFQGVYQDPYFAIYSTTENGDTLTIRSNYSLSKATCIVCGSQTYDGKIMCPTCYRKHIKRCLSCGLNYYSMDDNSTFCSECVRGKKTCPVCGMVFDEEWEECPACHWKSHCSLCGHTSNVPLYKIGNLYVCRDCREALLQGECDVCGSKTLTYPAAGWALCESCYGEAVTKSSRYKATTALSKALRLVNCEFLNGGQ